MSRVLRGTPVAGRALPLASLYQPRRTSPAQRPGAPSRLKQILRLLASETEISKVPPKGVYND